MAGAFSKSEKGKAVNHHCLSFGLAADEVSGSGEVFVVDAFEKHSNLLVDRGGVRRGVKIHGTPWGIFRRSCATRHGPDLTRWRRNGRHSTGRPRASQPTDPARRNDSQRHRSGCRPSRPPQPSGTRRLGADEGISFLPSVTFVRIGD